MAEHQAREAREDQQAVVVTEPEPDSTLDTQALIEEYESESPTRDLTGIIGWTVAIIAVLLSVYALYAARATITTQVYRTTFLGIALVLTFLLYPWRRRKARDISRTEFAIDVAIAIVLAGASLVVSLYPLTIALTWFPFDLGESFVRRAARPTDMDVWMGTIAILLIL
jgi:TRAP-type uncharacterized transport system fused permease subunit